MLYSDIRSNFERCIITKTLDRYLSVKEVAYRLTLPSRDSERRARQRRGSAPTQTSLLKIWMGRT